MHEKLKKLLEEEEHEQMHPMERHARESVLQDLRQQAHEMLGHKLEGMHDGMKKVSVMSDSPEGLEHGLSKAEELVSDEEHKDHSGKSEPEGEDLNKLGDLESPPDMDDDAAEDFKEDHEAQGLEAEANPQDGNDYGSELADGEEFPEHKDLSHEEIEKRIAHLHSLRNKGPASPKY